jgi:hypothetical protein
MGSMAVPVLVKVWMREKSTDIASILNRLGWTPEGFDQKMEFFGMASAWDKLVKLGEPAIPVLIKYHRFDELVSMYNAPLNSDHWLRCKNRL